MDLAQSHEGPLLSPSFDGISNTAFLGQYVIFPHVYDPNMIDFDPTLAESGASPTTMHLAARPPLETSATVQDPELDAIGAPVAGVGCIRVLSGVEGESILWLPGRPSLAR